MASQMWVMKFHLFNCDNTYTLDSVETFLLRMGDDLLRILVDRRDFAFLKCRMCVKTSFLSYR